MTDRTVAFVGLGAMGFPMALRVADSGRTVLAVERDSARCEAARAAGITICGIDGLTDADVVIAMVATAGQLDDVLSGDDGALASMRDGAVLVLMSTVGPAAVEKVGAQAAERGIAVLDMPVTGGVSGAEQGTLKLLAAGDSAQLDVLEPVLSTMGSVVRCGNRIGDGQAVKLVNQLLGSVHLVAAAEALAFAERLGLDADMVFRAVSSGAGGSWMLSDRGPRMLDDDAPALTMLDIFVKDSTLVAEAAADIGFDAPLLSAAHGRFRAAAELGHGRDDDSRVRNAYRR